MTIVRTITVEIHEDNSFTVREGDSYCPDLCWDEMLGTIAELTHPRLGSARYRMLSASQHASHQRKREERMEALAAHQREVEKNNHAISTALAIKAALEAAREQEMRRLTCWPYTEQK